MPGPRRNQGDRLRPVEKNGDPRIVRVRELFRRTPRRDLVGQRCDRIAHGLRDVEGYAETDRPLTPAFVKHPPFEAGRNPCRRKARAVRAPSFY